MKKNSIAQVIPIIRLKRNLNFFDYKIPNELLGQIKKGQLVEIPFRNKIIKGVVLNLTASSIFENKKLKSLRSIIDPLPFLNSWQLNLIVYLSNYYFISQAAWAKMIVPEIPKRIRQSKKNFLTEIDFLEAPKAEIKVDQYLKTSKPILLRYFYPDNKIETYLSLIKNITEQDKQIAIIVPQLSDVKRIYRYLLEYKSVTSVLLNDLPKNKYWQEWSKIKKGKAKIIIGTRSAIFAPFNKLGLIIIDQEENENHKQEEPNPRYNVKDVALKLKNLLKCGLIFSSSTPSFTSLYKAQKKEWSYFELDKLKAKPQISIIDKQDEFRKGNYSIFSEELLKKTEYNLKRARKIFLFLNRKGLATLATCKDCGYIAACPNCKLPLTLHTNKKLICHHCEYQEDLFLFCPKCKSPNIKLTGGGTEKIEIEIKKIFPQVNILKIDQETPWTNTDLSKYDIIIGTQYAFDFINWSMIDLICVINADISFSLPDFKSFEKTFNLLYKLALYIPNKKKDIIVQTFSPENYIFQAFKNLDYKIFYLNEAKERQIFKYPPFSQLIKLIYQSFEFNSGQEEINKVYNFLKSKSDNKKVIITPPLPVYTQQIRGRFRWQIIIKITDKEIDLDFLKDLPENIIIDRDPENLL